MRSRLIESDRLTVGLSDGETTPLAWEFLLDPHGRTGAENMAVDTSLLDESNATGRAVLRLYRFDPPCLSLGRNEPSKEYDRAAIARLHLDVVRRPTGGRAVWHEHELTYAAVAPIATFGGLRDAYRWIHDRLAAALRALGADATLAPDRPRASSATRPTSCFASSACGEVLVAGRKLIGSAQVREGRAFLQHGSILLDGSQEVIAFISRNTQATSREVTLAQVLGRRVTFDEVARAVMAAWGDDITSTIPHQPPPSSTAVFADPAWTWRR